jgi:predicted transcriptional regulator YdeE
MEEPKILTKPAFTVIGMKYRGKNEQGEIPQLWGKFMARAGEIRDKLEPDICYGVCDNHDDASGEFDYVAAFEVGDEVEIPDGMVKWDLPAQTYAVFTCTLPTIMEAYQYAYKSWLPESATQRTSGPEFELYDQDFDPNVPSSPMYLYVPVKT